MATEAVSGVDEAVGSGVYVGVVDLGGVSYHDEFAVFAHSGDDGFGFEGGELLGFIEDEVALGNGAAADVAEGFDFYDAFFDEGFVGFTAGAAGEEVLGFGGFSFFAGGGASTGGGGEEEFEGVVDGLQPGAHFFIEGAGEVAEGFASHGDDWAADGEAAGGAFEYGVEAGGYGEECFSGAGVAVAGD